MPLEDWQKLLNLLIDQMHETREAVNEHSADIRWLWVYSNLALLVAFATLIYIALFEH